MDNTLMIDKSHVLIDGRENLTKTLDESVFGEKMGLIAKLLGCWHNNVSRPFIQGKTAYRCCLKCGARRQFNPETLETFGAFYFPPAIEKTRNFNRI